MKTKFKVLVAFIVAICITTMGTVVNATTEFYDEDTDITVTLDKDIGIEGTTEILFNDFDYRNDILNDLGIDLCITDVKQQDINEYASAEKTYNAEVKIPLSKINISFDDVEKIYVVDGYDIDDEPIWKETESPIKIEEIDGQEYLVFSHEVCYVLDKDLVDADNNNRDVMLVEAHPIYYYSGGVAIRRFKIVRKDGSESEIRPNLRVYISSENQLPSNHFDVVDTYGNSYDWSRIDLSRDS